MRDALSKKKKKKKKDTAYKNKRTRCILTENHTCDITYMYIYIVYIHTHTIHYSGNIKPLRKRMWQCL